VPRRASAVIARLALGSALLWSAVGCSDAPAGEGPEAAPDGSGAAEQAAEPQGPPVPGAGGDTEDAEEAEDAEDGILRPSGSGPVWSDVITISDRRYAPDELLADADRELAIVNEDDEAHTLTTFDGTLDVEIGPGERVEVMTPPEPGAYPYVCRFHPEMGGEIDVMGMPR
jgi:plastocyanin